MLEEANCLRVRKVINHKPEYVYNGVEAFVCVTNICESYFVEKNLLHDENGDRFR